MEVIYPFYLASLDKSFRNPAFVRLLQCLLVIMTSEQRKTWLWLSESSLTRMINIMTIMKTPRVLLYLSLHVNS